MSEDLKKPFKIKRRHFVKAIATSATLGLIYPFRYIFKNKTIERNVSAVTRLSILQGATSETETQFSICLLTAHHATVYAMTKDGQRLNPSRVITNGHPFADHRFLTCFFSGLTLRQNYKLIVVNEAGVVLDQRIFSTLETTKRNFRSIVLSCAHHRNANVQESMWKAVEAASPEVIFFIGDSVYIDEDDPTQYVLSETYIWEKYTQARNLLYLYQMPKLVPVFATWDDHDTGTNAGNKNSPLIDKARNMFTMAFPNKYLPSIVRHTYGVGSVLNLFGLKIMLMDDRSYRTAYKDPNEETHWGAEQEALVAAVLKDSTAPVWIMNGSQYFGAYRGKGHESYEWVHPNSFKKFLNVLKNSKTPALLTSGDIHYSEIQKIEDSVVGYPLYEITSSSIHTREKSWYQIESNIKNRRLASTGNFNFIVTDVQVGQTSMKVKAQCMGKGSKIYFTEEFEVSRNS